MPIIVWERTLFETVLSTLVWWFIRFTAAAFGYREPQ